MNMNNRRAQLIHYSFYIIILSWTISKGMRVLKSSPDIKGGGDKVCLKPKCLKMAQEIKENMDESVDPCDNFYQYACGGWIKKNPIPSGKDEYSSIAQLSDRNDKNIKKLLTVHSSKDTDTILKVKNFYQSCLNLKKVNERGIKPLRKFINDLGSWGMSTDWDENKWDFNKTLRKLHREYPAEIFFTVDVDVDPKNRSTNIVTIDQAKLSLPQIEYFTNKKVIDTLQDYASQIAALAEGVKVTDFIRNRTKEIINLESRLARISVPKQSKRYARTSIKRLMEAIPQFPWLEHIREVLKPRKVGEKDSIVVLSNDYLADLVLILSITPKRDLSCYMMWRMVKDMVPFLSDGFTKAYRDFRDKLTGKSSNKSREETCFRYTDEILGPLVGSLFVRHEFTKTDKDEVEEMMHLIIKSFETNAENVSWISNQTLKSVKEKADAAVIKVGYPEYLKNETMFSQRYKEIEINPDTFFENVISIDKFSNMRTFRKLDKPVDPHQWVSVPHMANAFYVVTKNEIVIPAGILQRPFFYGYPAPRSVSYGAIGHVLGHELTHGFDTLGRRFNKYGELIQKRTRWSDPSIKIFENRAKCLVKQFSKYKIGDKLNIDGQNTLGENIADGGGLKIAYKAYKKWVDRNGEEYTLPLLNKSNDQLFFIGYAQKECHNSTHQALVEAIKDDVHAPSMFRIIGTLSDSREFAKAFSCRENCAMNPKEKCEVW